MFRQLFALVTGAILLVLGLMFSIALLAFVALAGLVAWGYFWWKTRALRKAMTQQASNTAEGGTVFEGEAVVVEEQPGRTTEILPPVTETNSVKSPFS